MLNGVNDSETLEKIPTMESVSMRKCAVGTAVPLPPRPDRRGLRFVADVTTLFYSFIGRAEKTRKGIYLTLRSHLPRQTFRSPRLPLQGKRERIIDMRDSCV